MAPTKRRPGGRPKIPAPAPTTRSARRSARRLWRRASTRSASRRRNSAPRRAPISRNLSPAAITAIWAGLPPPPSVAATRRSCGPRREPSLCSGSTMRPPPIRSASRPLRPMASSRSMPAAGITTRRSKGASGRWRSGSSDAGRGRKLFVDTAPVMEKPLAQRAGLGWQGKHTNLVSRNFGSWLFLGEIYLSLELSPDPPQHDHCGSCRRCLDACPTNAFPAPYRLDARRCISYLTIEHKGMIPLELRPLIGNRIYGCDDCLAVCPWNKFARAAHEADFAPREALTAPRLAALAGLDDAGFRRLFSGSPIKRTGRDRFVRNVLIAIGNAGAENAAPELLAAVLHGLDDPAPLVRASAVWALSRLSPPRFRAERDGRLGGEDDPLVVAEWRREPRLD